MAQITGASCDGLLDKVSESWGKYDTDTGLIKWVGKMQDDAIEAFDWVLTLIKTLIH